MKKSILATLFIHGSFLMQAQTMLPVLDAETGNPSYPQSICWRFDNFSHSNQSNRITGNYSLRSSNLNSSNDNNTISIKSPWVKPTTGSITLKGKLESNSGNAVQLQFSYIPINSREDNYEGTKVSFYTYTFPQSGGSPSVQTISVALPAALVNATQACRIFLEVTGGSNTNRVLLDDVAIPATYASNASNNCRPTVQQQDSDGDEACDDEEDHDSDETRAYNNYYPSASGYGRLMFEDLWPGIGDYDFNDLVLSYRYNYITNSSNRVTEIQLLYIVEAVGASQQHGFAIQLDGISNNTVSSVTGTRTSGASWLQRTAAGLESGQTYANVIVYDNVNRFVQNQGTIGINTTPGTNYSTPDTALVVIRFNSNNSIRLQDIHINPYLIVNQTRNREVHLVNFAPTSKANQNLLGTSEDNSNVNAGRYYISKNNLPWALDIPELVPYMKEKEDITHGYLNLVNWARSNGSSHTNWYKNQSGNRADTKFYNH